MNCSESYKHLQASSAAGGADILVSEMLPQLLPLFTCTAAQRELYGCSVPAAPGAKSGTSMALSSGEVMGQSMHQRMHQALELASHSVPGKQSGRPPESKRLLKLHSCDNAQGGCAVFVTLHRTSE